MTYHQVVRAAAMLVAAAGVVGEAAPARAQGGGMGGGRGGGMCQGGGMASMQARGGMQSQVRTGGGQAMLRGGPGMQQTLMQTGRGQVNQLTGGGMQQQYMQAMQQQYLQAVQQQQAALAAAWLGQGQAGAGGALDGQAALQQQVALLTETVRQMQLQNARLAAALQRRQEAQLRAANQP